MGFAEELPLFSETPGLRRESSEQATWLTPGISLSAAIRAWGESLEQAGKSIHTVKAFTSDLRLLARFIDPGQSVDSLGTHDLKHFLDWMVEHRGISCSPKTYSRRVTSIKAFFRWLTDAGLLDSNPADPIPQQTVLSPLPQILNPEEEERVRHAADAMRKRPRPDARPYTLASLLLDTGVKKGECLAIHMNHIDLMSPEGAILFIRYGEAAKRYKERKLPLPPDWVRAYREYLGQYKPQDRLFPWSPRRLEYLLEDLGEAAGLEKHLSFDMCRWTFALRNYESGMQNDKIRQKLGISKIQWREVGNKLDRLAAISQQSD